MLSLVADSQNAGRAGWAIGRYRAAMAWRLPRPAAVAALAVAAVLGAACAPPPPPPTAPGDLPVVYSVAAGRAAGATNPEGPPPGANDWSCRPDPARPRPVVLVHGLVTNMADNGTAASPLLSNRGFCVFALNHSETPLFPGVYGGGPVRDGARELSDLVDRVLDATGAAQVDLVGFSAGGVVAREYLRVSGGSAVGALVTLGTPHSGTSLLGLDALLRGAPALIRDLVGAVCPACTQVLASSEVIATLVAAGQTVPGVRYTNIATIYDQVTVPYTSSLMAPGPQVTNIVLQDGCPLDFSEHVALPFDRIALGHVLNALDPANALPPPCVLIPLGNGG